jgi:hypothetical protein
MNAVAKDVVSEVAPAKERLRRELEAADIALDEIDSFVHVCTFALRGQDCDVDRDVAVVLDEVYGRSVSARERIQNALDLLQEVAP